MSEIAKNDKKNKNKKSKIMLSLILILSLTVLGIKIYIKKGLSPVNVENPKEIILEIPSGSTTSQIANLLKDEGLIKNKFAFKWIVSKDNFDGQLKAGEYVLNNGMDTLEIIEELRVGGKNKNVISFNIPEGYELKQIATKLEQLGLANKDVFIELASDVSNFWDKYLFLKQLPKGQSLEGFLFPATYEIYKDSNEEEIIEKMLSKFEKIYEKDLKNKMKKTGLDLNQIVTLASIVEREARVDEERPIISGVFHNRLKKEMLLQSCATVQYALGERKSRLYEKDLKIESDYNTYLHKGLPPGPIASPGKESLISAVEPADVDYLFFVLKNDNSGTHVFSKTYEEHKKAKAEK